MDKLEEMNCFSTSVYVIQKDDFLESVREVSEEYLKPQKKDDEYLAMSGSFIHEEKVAPFAQYISQTAWNILASQGYAVDKLATYFTEMWTQEHRHGSSMDTHVHGQGSQMSCFYFINVPEDSCKLVIHDPRPAKVVVSLPEADSQKISDATTHIVLTPKEGMMIFTNSWLAHSFTKNLSQEPMRFVHMNLSVMPVPENPNVEVV